MSQNFEELYNKLKEEFESSKKDNDELCKEYESTIEMLSDSVENFKKEKEALEQKLSRLEQDQKNFKKEKESLMNKNKDKIIDIQNLNKQNDRLSNEVKRLKEEKTLFDSKIVNLENDNEHFQNKIREYEVLAEDLENQLESALEENITLQTEFETYKQTTGDQLIRKDEEIRDIKNDLINKEKFIQRLQRGNNALLVKNIQKNINEGGAFKERRRFTLLPGSAGGGNKDLLAFQRTLAARGLLGNSDENSENSDKSDNKNNINKTNTLKNISDRYRARNSVYSPGLGALAKLVKQREELSKGIGDNGKKENKPIAQTRENSTNNAMISNFDFDNKVNEKNEKDEEQLNPIECMKKYCNDEWNNFFTDNISNKIKIYEEKLCQLRNSINDDLFANNDTEDLLGGYKSKDEDLFGDNNNNNNEEEDLLSGYKSRDEELFDGGNNNNEEEDLLAGYKSRDEELFGESNNNEDDKDDLVNIDDDRHDKNDKNNFNKINNNNININIK